MAFRGAAIAALAAWIAATVGGTVPINEAVLEWSASAPPATWRAQVDRWKHLNTLRTWAAVIAFISLSVSLALGALR
jgi:anthrone oxygenase-like protein